MSVDAQGDELELVQYDLEDDGIAVVTINRPDKLNALNRRVLMELETCVRILERDDRVRVVIITGAGSKSFVAGADVAEFRDLDQEKGRQLAERGQEVFRALERMRKPVIAAIGGFALGGGCELALACHIRIASETARFGQPEVKLGLLPGYGGTQRLPRVIGLGPATELIVTGAMIDASRAYALGLVSMVVEPEALMGSAREMARTILQRSPVAVALSLEALAASDRSLQEGLAVEAELFGKACGTEDFREGVAAFLERRAPEFPGR